MKPTPLVLTGILFCLVNSQVASGEEAIFSGSSPEMVDKLLSSRQFGMTRSFSAPKTRSITVTAVEENGSDYEATIQIPIDPPKEILRLRVEFDTNSASLRKSAHPTLTKLATALKDQRLATARFCIQGHTDSDGDNRYNLRLSLHRARSVLNYLTTTEGIDEERVAIFGYGEAVPLKENNSSSNKQINRRVEVSLQCPTVAAKNQ